MSNLQVSIPAGDRTSDTSFRVPKIEPGDTLTVQDGETYTVSDTEEYNLVQNDGTLQVSGTLQITGGVRGFSVDDVNLDKSKHWYVHIQNGYDVNVDVTALGTHLYDPSMDKRLADGATETISSGENGIFDGTSGHSYLQLEVDPAATPTSGDLVVTIQVRR